MRMFWIRRNLFYQQRIMLTTRQRQLLEYLRKGRSLEAALNSLGLNWATLREWEKTRAFKRALEAESKKQRVGARTRRRGGTTTRRRGDAATK